MKSLLLALLLLAPTGDSKPKFTVSPRTAPEPAVVTFLLTNIAEGSRTACFILEGENQYLSCKDIDGRLSFRLEHKNVYAGHYQAIVGIDGKRIDSVKEVIITE